MYVAKEMWAVINDVIGVYNAISVTLFKFTDVL